MISASPIELGTPVPVELGNYFCLVNVKGIEGVILRLQSPVCVEEMDECVRWEAGFSA